MNSTHIIQCASVVLLSLSIVAASPKSPDEIESSIQRVIHGIRPVSVLKNVNRYGDRTTLQDRMRYYRTPGVSIAVVNDYRIEWARGFGICEEGKSDPVTERTLFQAASISKPIFALAVMRLVDQGKLDLDEDVNRYLKSWKVPANGSWQPRITLRQILSHSAGLTVHGFPGYRAGEKIPTVLQVLNGEPPANTPAIQVDILPGVQTRYSGGGTTVAGLLMVDVTGKPLTSLMRNLVLDPAGMADSTFDQPITVEWAKRAATAHDAKGEPIRGKWHVYPELAPDGLWTTPSDLAKAALEIQLALRGETNRLLQPKTAGEMLTPVLETVGIAFMTEGEGNGRRFGHGGANEGFLSDMTMYCNGRGAVVMLNSNEGFPLLREIERTIAEEYHWPDFTTPDFKEVKLPAEVLDRFVGTYTNKSRQEFAISKNEEKLFLTVGRQPSLELHPDSKTNFFATVVNAEVRFEAEENGAMNLALEQDHETVTARRK